MDLWVVLGFHYGYRIGFLWVISENPHDKPWQPWFLHTIQWIGLWENSQESPMIFMGKSLWFPVKIFP